MRAAISAVSRRWRAANDSMRKRLRGSAPAVNAAVSVGARLKRFDARSWAGVGYYVLMRFSWKGLLVGVALVAVGWGCGSCSWREATA
jgi:hypothetical protein